MTMLWRGLCILPLLFVSGNCHFLFPFLHHFRNPVDNGLNFGGGGDIERNAGGFPGGGFFPIDNGGFSGKHNNDGNDDDEDLDAKKSVKVVDGSADKINKKDKAKDNVETKYKGKWELFTKNSGVSAMHLVILPKIDQAVIFDATVWKISKLKLPGPPCRIVEGTNEQDCFCHSVLLDFETAKIRPLRVHFSSYLLPYFFINLWFL